MSAPLTRLVSAALVAGTLASTATLARADERPNIVLIFTDDQGYGDVGCFGAEGFKTPHLDRMAEEGIRFTDFYVGCPVCSGSRAALLTGCHYPRVSMSPVLFPGSKTGLNPKEITIAEVVKPLGYATACIGKWHQGHLPPFLPTRQGFDYYFGIPYSNDMTIDPAMRLAADVVLREGMTPQRIRSEKPIRNKVPLLRGQEVIEYPVDQATLTRRYTEEAIRFMREHRDEPFLVYLPHSMCHVPLFASAEFRDRAGRSLFGAVIEELDWSVGQILRTLKELKLDEKTLVIFTTDNGAASGSSKPLRAKKGSLYDGGIRVPCIMRWPGKIPAGRVCSEVAATIDLLPTIAQLTGGKTPDDRVIDGKSIWPLMQGLPEAKSPHEAYIVIHGGKAALRSGQWKFYPWPEGADRRRRGQPAPPRPQGPPVQLYDVSVDIGETNNVAGEHPEVVSHLQELVAAHREDLSLNRRPAGQVRADAAGQGPPQALARQILQSTGVQGGLIVHLGCGDGRLTAALRQSDGYLVQGLDADAQKIRQARRHIGSLGLYGDVSVDRFDGKRLPYIDNLVNLVVSEQALDVPMDEVMRVLAPHGVAYVKTGDTWTKTVKPRPAEIDEWTHYLHDATGNAVAHDTVVGPPRRAQWVGSPKWSRHHDRMSSVSAVVSAGGRVFTIFDETPPVSILTSPSWTLIARDAFNGTILWKRPIDQWHTHLWPLKSGPAQLPRRLVAAGDRVYVTLSLDGPLVALDAASGETVRTYRGTRATEEVIFCDGVLFALVNDAAEKPDYDGSRRFGKGYGAKFWDETQRQITAVRADTAEVLWTDQRRVLPGTLAADRRRVVFHDGQSTVCLDRNTGKQLWRSDPVPRSKEIRGFYVPTLVLYQDVVLFSGGETAGLQTGSWYTSGEDTMTALSAETGKVLWTAYHPPTGYRSPEDLLVVDGLVWTGETTSGRALGVFSGRDPQTGEVKREFKPDVDIYWFHHRCYRAKATDNFLLMARAGTEFVDVRQQHWTTNHWVRGACSYGVMPANGLIYAPQHPCACYLEAKLNGFNALAPASKGPRIPEAAARVVRLEKGPAYATGSGRQSGGGEADDWPTYRHDAARSGQASTSLPKALKPAWKTHLGGKLTSPVIAEGKVFVASIHTHTVHALDAASGNRLWDFTAGGRVDSPPTIYRGRVLFGSADGWVYCLRASDGALAWRFRAAPMDQRMTAFEQVESVWPVPGSVLVQDGVAYCVAGRSMFLDGGLRLWRLDPLTGRVLSQTVLDDTDPATGENLQSHVSWLNMPVALPDVLTCDGRLVYMRSQPFKLDGTRLPLQAMPRGANADAGAPPATQRADHAHLFCPTGLLDDSWFHRTYWLYGSRFVSGWCGYYRSGKAAPAGRILVFDDSKVYGFGRKLKYFRWTTPIEHHLFAADKVPPASDAPANADPKKTPPLVAHHWTQDLPLFARAMVLADGTLFVAGPRDMVDEEQALKQIADPQVQQRLADQATAFAGKRGALLWAVSADGGQKLAEFELDAPPVFDGMAAAAGRLYLSTQSGAVECFAGR